MASYQPDLILQSDSDKNLLDYKNCFDSFLLSDSVVGNISNESSDPFVTTTSLTVQRPHGDRTTQPRSRSYIW